MIETDNLSDVLPRSELLRFFVGGVLYELSEELIQKRASKSILARKDRRAQFYDVNKNIYVFDQPANVFEVLVYFISTGLLSRPVNISTMKLYSMLIFFEMDDIIIDTFKRMEQLVFEINWEKSSEKSPSWIHTLFGLPFSSKPKILNTFLFVITMISYGNLCFEYTLISLFKDNITTTTTTNGNFYPTSNKLSYILEIIYLILLLIEISFRFIYVSNKIQYFSNYFTFIDLLSILSCIIYLSSLFSIISNDRIIQFIVCFRFIRIFKLSRYSTYIRQYIQTIVFHFKIFLLLLLILLCLCTFFGHLTYGISLIDREHISSTPLETFYYCYETILTIGFGIHRPSTPYLTWITLTSQFIVLI
ncbi:hypothetical protein I4U23_029790 [Adineta vaga]|nr:hypothetical protein I4U23_029790 [Adineta vaga]